MRASPSSALTAAARRALGSRQINHLVRYDPVLELVREIPVAQPTLLDVGSGSRGIGPLLGHDWRATSIDADFSDYGAASGQTSGTQVLGDVRALPFANREFDFVIAVDLLEHVPASDREQAVREICRVARRRAVIACPAGEQALAGDRELARILESRGRPVPPWLTEHLDNGFPTGDEIVAAASAFGTPRLLANESVAAHQRLVLAELRPASAVALRLLCGPLELLLAGRRPRQRALARRVLGAVRDGDRPPAYRAVVAVDIADARQGHSARHSNE
jgi:SAM-dependent methyltransferase